MLKRNYGGFCVDTILDPPGGEARRVDFTPPEIASDCEQVRIAYKRLKILLQV
jgi:hypothetical protein